MNWETFAELMQYMVDTFGVAYGWGEKDFDFPTNEFECNDAWFDCPECGEPIYYCDWKDEIVGNLEFAPDGICCPICDAAWTEAIYGEEE